MSIPSASISTRNVRLSTQRVLKAWADSESFTMAFTEALFDPDALDGGTSLSKWGAISWITGLAGAKGASVFQVDIVTKWQDDPVGNEVLTLSDSLQTYIRNLNRIDMYDFSAVVSVSDTETLIPSNPLVVMSEGGHIGMRSAILGPVRERDLWRISLTFRVQLLTDFSKGNYYPA